MPSLLYNYFKDVVQFLGKKGKDEGKSLLASVRPEGCSGKMRMPQLQSKLCHYPYWHEAGVRLFRDFQQWWQCSGWQNNFCINLFGHECWESAWLLCLKGFLGMKGNVNPKFVLNSLLTINRVCVSAECIKSLHKWQMWSVHVSLCCLRHMGFCPEEFQPLGTHKLHKNTSEERREEKAVKEDVWKYIPLFFLKDHAEND